MTTVKLSEVPADSSVGGSEKLLALDSTTTKTLTTAQMAAYTIDVLAAAATATPTTGDYIVAYRGTDEKRLTLDAVSSYAVASAWSVATTASSCSSGDLLLLQRTGTVYDVNIDTIKTYVNTGAQATVLNLSGLEAATLATTDLLVVCQTTTPKKVALSALETKLWADRVTHVNGLTAVTSGADSDLFWTIQGGAEKKVTAQTLAAYVAAEVKNDMLGDVFDDADTVTATQDGDVYLFERSGVRKVCNAEYVADYVIAEFGAEGAITAATGDKLAGWHGATAGTLTVDTVSSFTQSEVLAWAAVNPPLGTDTVLLNRSSAGKQVTVDNLATYVLSKYVLTTAGLSSATLSADDEFLAFESDAAKVCTLTELETKLWADYQAYVAALTDVSALADADAFYVLDGGVGSPTAKYTTALEIATYVTAELWDSAAAASVATGNTFLLNVSGDTKEATVDQLATFVHTSSQATILNLTTLSEQTSISATDKLLLCQTTTPVYAELSDVADAAFDLLDTYVDALSPTTSLTGTEKLYCLQGATALTTTVADIAAHAAAEVAEQPWSLVAGSKYTATPASTSTITMSDTSDFTVGTPVKYVYNGSTYYGIVTAINANALLTIAGATLATGGGTNDLTALYAGKPERVINLEYFVTTAYGNAVQDIFSAVTYERHKWQHADAYLVTFGATNGVADTGAAQPKVNVKIAGNLISTDDSSKGISLSATPGTWTDNGAVAIKITSQEYNIERGDAIDIRCTEAGTNGDADCLSVSLVFVLE